MTSPNLTIDKSVPRLLTTLAVVGIALTAISAIIVPERTWASSLLVAYYLVTLGLGGAVFIAVANVTGAGWHTAFRRVPEAFTSVLPVSSVILFTLLAVQVSRYTWHFHGTGDAGTFWFKELWLSPLFFIVRAVLYITLWIVFSQRLVRVSHQQDRLTTHSPARINTTASAVFLAVFALSFSLASIDWIMALEPMWFSTIWGVYHFSGLFQSTLAALIVAGILLRRAGHLQGIFRDEHLHDLGKLLIGFSCFWMYIWFCQYMLIWYSNIPEETVYFSNRLQGSWGPMIIASVILNWGVPFLVLLPKQNKRRETVMLRVAGIVLVGRWVDLSVMIYPPVLGDATPLGVPEIAAAVGGAGLAGWLFLRAFQRTNPVPLHDPLLEESLLYSN
jgi:hypothetical protein